MSSEVLVLEREIARIDEAIRIASCDAESNAIKACDAQQQLLSAPPGALWVHALVVLVGAVVVFFLFRHVLYRWSQSWSVLRVKRSMDKLLHGDRTFRLAAAVSRKTRRARSRQAIAKVFVATTVVLCYAAFVACTSRIVSSFHAPPELLVAVLRLPGRIVGDRAITTAASQYAVFSCGLPVLTFAFFLLSSAGDDLRCPSIHEEGSPMLRMAHQILTPTRDPSEPVVGQGAALLTDQRPPA